MHGSRREFGREDSYGKITEIGIRLPPLANTIIIWTLLWKKIPGSAHIRYTRTCVFSVILDVTEVTFKMIKKLKSKF